LALQRGARGLKVLVPEGWTLEIIDGGGSGSSSTWTDPNDSNAKIAGDTGGELAAWYEADGVSGSVNPTSMLPPGAHIVRYNYTQFGYSATAQGHSYPINGVWVANIGLDGKPSFYSQVEISLPASMQSVTTTILNDFLRSSKGT